MDARDGGNRIGSGNSSGGAVETSGAEGDQDGAGEYVRQTTLAFEFIGVGETPTPQPARCRRCKIYAALRSCALVCAAFFAAALRELALRSFAADFACFDNAL